MANSAQVHRFRDVVAISVGIGKTVYMTYQEAQQLAKALNRVAKSVKTESFADSSGNTFQLLLSDDYSIKVDRK